MLGFIAQAIANQVSPIVNQLSNQLGNQISPVVNQFLQSASPVLQQIPRSAYIAAARILSRPVSKLIEQAQSDALHWYHSLPPEAKKRLDNAIFWAIKDATGDMITIYSGLPLKPLIDKVFDKVKEWKGNPHAEHYVENKLKKQIELHKKN